MPYSHYLCFTAGFVEYRGDGPLNSKMYLHGYASEMWNRDWQIYGLEDDHKGA